jgi:DNA-binding response OmpR family regulator
MRMGDQTTLAPAGFSDFIGKPVAPDLLLAKLAHHLGRERSPEGSGGG